MAFQCFLMVESHSNCDYLASFNYKIISRNKILITFEITRNEKTRYIVTVILSILSRYRYWKLTWRLLKMNVGVTQHELDRYPTFTFTLGNGITGQNRKYYCITYIKLFLVHSRSLDSNFLKVIKFLKYSKSPYLLKITNL